MGTTPVVFDAREAAALLGVQTRSIARWVATGRMKTVKRAAGPRGAYFFTAEEVSRVAALPPLPRGRYARKRPGPDPAPPQAAELPLDAS